MDYPALGRVQHTKCEWYSVLANMPGGKFCHSVQLSFSRLAKAVGVDDESVLTIQAPTHDLKQQHFECVKQLAILGQGKVRIVTTQVEQASLVGPMRFYREVKPEVRYDLR